MKCLVHTPSEVRELLAEDYSFDIIGPHREGSQYPMVVEFENEDEAKEAIALGIVVRSPED